MITKHKLFAPTLLLSFLLNAANSVNADDQTTVYKAVSEDGSISFSDEAQIGSEAIKVKPVTTIPAIDIKQNKSLSVNDSQAKDYYQSLSIISPSNDTAINSGGGNVAVVVEAKPDLRNSDSFKLELDGTEVATQKGTTFNLNNVDRGTHTLSVKIINRNNQTLKAAISTMTIHRPISQPASVQPIGQPGRRPVGRPVRIHPVP